MKQKETLRVAKVLSFQHAALLLLAYFCLPPPVAVFHALSVLFVHESQWREERSDGECGPAVLTPPHAHHTLSLYCSTPVAPSFPLPLSLFLCRSSFVALPLSLFLCASSSLALPLPLPPPPPALSVSRSPPPHPMPPNRTHPFTPPTAFSLAIRAPCGQSTEVDTAAATVQRTQVREGRSDVLARASKVL